MEKEIKRYEDIIITDKYDGKAICEYFMNNHPKKFRDSGRYRLRERRIGGIYILKNNRCIPMIMDRKVKDYNPRQLEINEKLSCLTTFGHSVGPKIKRYNAENYADKTFVDIDITVEQYNELCLYPFLRIHRILFADGTVWQYKLD